MPAWRACCGARRPWPRSPSAAARSPSRSAGSSTCRSSNRSNNGQTGQVRRTCGPISPYSGRDCVTPVILHGVYPRSSCTIISSQGLFFDLQAHISQVPLRYPEMSHVRKNDLVIFGLGRFLIEILGKYLLVRHTGLLCKGVCWRVFDQMPASCRSGGRAPMCL